MFAMHDCLLAFSTGQGNKDSIVLVASLFVAITKDQVLSSFEEQMVDDLLFAWHGHRGAALHLLIIPQSHNSYVAQLIALRQDSSCILS